MRCCKYSSRFARFGRDVRESFSAIELPTGLKIVSDLHSISLGHLQILEQIIGKQGMDDFDKLKLLAQFAIRPSDEGDLLNNADKEKEAAHLKLINTAKIGAIFKAIDGYKQAREYYLYKRFNGVLYQPKREDDEEPIEVDMNNTAAIARAAHEKKFFWHKINMEIAGDIFHLQDALNLPLSKVMPILAEKRSEANVARLEQIART